MNWIFVISCIVDRTDYLLRRKVAIEASRGFWKIVTFEVVTGRFRLVDVLLHTAVISVLICSRTELFTHAGR